MDRNDLPRASRRDHRRGHAKPPPAGIVERDGHWHVHTSVRIAGRRLRLRRSTGLAAGPGTIDDAEALRDQWLGEIRKDAIHGVKPTVALGVAARDYLRRPRVRPLNFRDVGVVHELVRAFGLRPLDKIADAEWKAYVDARNAGNKLQTRERWIAAAFAFLNWCREMPREYLRTLPAIERLKSKELRQLGNAAADRRQVSGLRPDLVALMIENASWHYAPQLAVIWSTGARVSSILYGCRLCDAILAPGNERIVFHGTKSGEAVTAALHPWAADQVRRYLERRGRLEQRESPLFLTDRGRPYADNGKTSGGQNKSAFKGMRRRTVRALLRRFLEARKAGDRPAALAHRADARLVRRVTQHWFRHMLATELLSQGTDVRTIMDQAGWDDIRSLMRYAHTVDQVRRQAIASRPMGEILPASKARSR